MIAQYTTEVKKFGKCGICKRKVSWGSITFTLTKEHGYRCRHNT